jgi:hypothetical protein
MRFCKFKNRFSFLILISCFLPARSLAEIKTWTGYGGDSRWINPLNWSNQVIPLGTDDVLLDNGDLPVSYQVIMPDQQVILRTLQIKPSPGRNIELILPVSNILTDAFSVTGPGYGIALFAGAIFRNASGLSSGESLQIADSIIIYDGARYIHQTRAAHASSILRYLSTAPGTEQGIFDFDVPRAAYTVSVSNRIYGSLELHANAYSGVVSYTCTGANPLQVRGNFRLGSNVHLSMNLSGANGNMMVQGDFIQEGGQLNLEGGGSNNTVLRVNGDLYQSPGAVITETSNGNPVIELNGNRLQEIAMAGQIRNQVGFRTNNLSGARLQLTLTLPWNLDLLRGNIYSSQANLLILDSGCTIQADSTASGGAYVDGPLRKQGLNREDHFLFPVGKDGYLRWLELKQVTGNFTAEYMHQNPESLGNNLGTGIDHISKLEYWTLTADGMSDEQAILELSYSTPQSGGVTDPNYLTVAGFQASKWENAGHSAFTGNFNQGSVLSNPVDFSASGYALASTVNLENPLPVTVLDLKIKEVSGNAFFSWTVQSTEEADYFELLDETGGFQNCITRIEAVKGGNIYQWSDLSPLQKGKHYFRIRMTDIHGEQYTGETVPFEMGNEEISLRWLPGISRAATGKILIRTSQFPVNWKYDIISVSGQIILQGKMDLREELTIVSLNPGMISEGIYIFRAFDSRGNIHSLEFKSD